MDRLDPLDAAQRIVGERFPNVIAAFLAGSALTSRRTETSDLDIVVVLPGPPAPFRETLRLYGWVVELFVQTPTSLEYYWDLEAKGWRSILLRMCADSHIVATTGSSAADIQVEARRLLTAGQPLVSSEKLLYRRYALTDLLDDFRGTTDLTELVFISSALLSAAGKLILLSEGRWLGSSKWLSRHLADLDAGLLDRLVVGQLAVLAHGDREPLCKVASKFPSELHPTFQRSIARCFPDPFAWAAARVSDRHIRLISNPGLKGR
jgi:hypothetical protein